MAGPFRQIIENIRHSHAVEDVAARAEGIGHARRRPEIEEGGKGEPHIPPFVGYGCAAYRAADFARYDSLTKVQRAAKEAKLSYASRESDVPLMEYRGPLHGRAVQGLTITAMTDLGVYRIVSDFVTYGAAMAPGVVLGNEILCTRGSVLGT